MIKTVGVTDTRLPRLTPVGGVGSYHDRVPVRESSQPGSVRGGNIYSCGWQKLEQGVRKGVGFGPFRPFWTILLHELLFQHPISTGSVGLAIAYSVLDVVELWMMTFISNA